MKTISPRFLPTTIGALIGGTLLEQENDATGLALGLGIGALTGYNFRVTLPEANKLIYRDKLIALPEERLSDLDKKKQELRGILDKFPKERFNTLPGVEGVPYDKTDIYGTLNKDNIHSAISDATDIEELRRIKIAAMNPERFTPVGDPNIVGNSYIKSNPKTFINIGDKGQNLEEAMDILRTKFSFLGYSQEELEAKLVIFKSAIADVDRVILDEQTDNITVSKDGKNTVFRLSSSHSLHGMSSNLDTNNMYSVRSLNPLAKQLILDSQLSKNSIANVDGNQLAKTLGIENPDKNTLDVLNNVDGNGLKIMNSMHLDAKKFSPEELRTLANFLGKNKFSGYQPEDLKALLFASPLYNEHREVFDTWLDSAYQHRQNESAFRALGFGRDYLETKAASNLTARLSGQQDFGMSFNINADTGQIDLDNPLRTIGYKGSEFKKSEHREFLERLRQIFPGVDDGKKADHNNIATNGKRKYVSPYNINAPMERNPYTSSRDVLSSNLGKNSIANTFDVLKQMGRIPDEYSTAIAARRLSVDENRFNRDIMKFGGMFSGFNTISDGGSIGSSRAMGNFNTLGYRTVEVSPDKGGLLELSDKVLNLVQDRQRKNISANHTGLSSKKLLDKLERASQKATELQGQIETLRSKPLPNPSAPDQRFTISDLSMVGERIQKVISANQNYLAKYPTANSDPFIRPVTREDAWTKINHDYSRGVPYNQIGYESATNNVDLAREARDLELQKLEQRLGHVKNNVEGYLSNLRTMVDTKITTEGASTSLTNINNNIASLASRGIPDLNSVAELREQINNFNVTADTTFKPGELVGIDGNGKAVKLSDEFHEFKLIGSSFSNVDLTSGRMKGNFIFKGSTNIGDMGTIKTFSIDHKQNIAITDENTFAYAQAQAMFNSIFAEDIDTTGSLLGTSAIGKHSVQNVKKEYKQQATELKKQGSEVPDYMKHNHYIFRNRETGELVKLNDKQIINYIDKIARDILEHPYSTLSEIAVISSMDNNGQIIAQKIADTLMLEDKDQVVSKLLDVKNGIQGKNSLSTTIAESVSQLARRNVNNYVPASEAWALGQMAQSFTENKASMSSLLGMRLLGTNRLERDLEIVATVATKMSNPGAKNILSSKERAYLAEITKSIDSVLGEGYVVSKVRELTNNGQVSYSPEFKKVFTQEVMKDFDEKVSNFESNFSSAGQLAKFISEGGINEDTANLFRYAYTNYGESVMIASPDASQGYATGSGRLSKTISHMAQTQLLAAGMSKDTLSVFGNLDQGSLYDYKALTTLDMNMDGKTTLNTLIDSMVFDKDGNFDKAGYQRAYAMVKRLSVSDPDTVRTILKEVVADEDIVNELTKGEFLRFELGSNKHNMTNLPIYMENTARNSAYVSEDGTITKKPLQRAQEELLETAFLHTYAPHQSGPGSEKLEQSIRKYVKIWTGMVGNMNEPMLKDVLARHAPNSSYSKVIATSNTRLGELVEKSLDNSGNNPLKGRSFAGISRSKAAQIVQQYYGDEFIVSSKSFKEVHEQQIKTNDYNSVKSIDDFIDSKTGLLRVTTREGDSIPLYTMLNREPAHSSFSISPYELMVLSDTETGNSKNSLDSIFIHEKDMHYEALMVGDFDNDHILMYSMYRQISNEQAKDLEDYTIKIASVRNDLIPLMKSLGVKGAKETNNPESIKHIGIYDVTRSMQILEERLGDYKPEGVTVDEFRKSDAYWEAVSEIVNERRGDASVKGGVRKTLSAPVVQLSVHLANAVHTSKTLNQDFLTHAVAKTLNHALVENIIKTQHISTEEFGNKTQLDVENIFNLRRRLEKGDPTVKADMYRKELKRFFNDMISTAKDSGNERLPEILELEAKLKSNGTSFEAIIDEIIDTDIRNIKDPKYAPTSILDYAKIAGYVTEEDFNARMLAEHTRDAVSKVHGDQLSLVDYESEEAPSNIRKSFNQGFDELLKVAKQNLTENQRTLAVGGALLGVGAVLSQKDPDFSANKSVRADVQAGTIAPAMQANMQTRDTDAALKSQGRDKSEYIRPGKGLDKVKQNYSVNASYQGQEGREAVGAKEAIFGKNITSVNINSNNSY